MQHQVDIKNVACGRMHVRFACGCVQVGQFEPITRRPLQAEQLVGNTRLRQATQQYLDDHPWAWKECYS